MTAAAIFAGMALIILILAGLCLGLLIDVHRINRNPDDEYPRSRFNKGEWDDQN